MIHVRIGNIAVQLARVCCFEDLGAEGVRVHFADPHEPIMLKDEGAEEARDYMKLLPTARESPLLPGVPHVIQGRSAMSGDSPSDTGSNKAAGAK